MKNIDSHDYVTAAISMIRSHREGFLTNYYISEERCNLLIQKQLFYSVSYEKCIFILHKDYEFYHIYFFVTNQKQLEESLEDLIRQYPETAFVVDIVGNQVAIDELISVFALMGFENYTLLYRMNRLKNLDEPQILDPQINYAEPDNSSQIQELLEKYFDKYSEQIPLPEEISQWIAGNTVLVISEQKEVIGFVIFEIHGVTSYLRYWFVHPARRDKKIGSALLRRFFHECRNTKRQLFWVIAANQNAILRYEHYGFISEPLFDQVMIKS
jgi:ribosomal protein S18 acetylase RimI-like enzyme